MIFGASPALIRKVPSVVAAAIEERFGRRLDPDRSPPDEFVWVARTKLTNAYFDSILKTTSTARNWKTVLKLVELA